jgi:hypothetical protein
MKMNVLKQSGQQSQIVTPQLMKEIPFFKKEPIIGIFVTFVAMMLFMGGLIGVVGNGMFFALILFVAFYWGMYAIKRIKYLPSGDKIFVEKVYADTGVAIEIMKLPKDGLIKWKGTGAPDVTVERTNKHFEKYTGKPFVKIMQGHSHNYSALDLAEGKMDKTGAEVASISSMSFDAGYHIASDNARKTIEWSKRTESLMPMVTIIGIALIAILTFAQFGQLNELVSLMRTTATAVGAGV